MKSRKDGSLGLSDIALILDMAIHTNEWLNVEEGDYIMVPGLFPEHEMEFSFYYQSFSESNPNACLFLDWLRGTYLDLYDGKKSPKGQKSFRARLLKWIEISNSSGWLGDIEYHCFVRLNPCGVNGVSNEVLSEALRIVKFFSLEEVDGCERDMHII